MTPTYRFHATYRQRGRHVPAEAVLLVLAEPEREDVLDAGCWNERYMSRRQFGRRVLYVVWREDSEGFVVITMWWKFAPRNRRMDRR